MKWIEDYATGIQRIDHQHKTIFEMAEDFRVALDEGAGGRVYSVLLDNLDVYCRGHFGVEERCMEEYRCPVAQTNKEGHAIFVEVLAGFRQRYTANGYRATDARELIDTVDQWLSGHICRIDVQLKQCVVGV